MEKILVINGPNLNMLGIRKTDVYGTKTLTELEDYITQKFKNVADIEYFQSNCEGKIIDAIHKKHNTVYKIVINAGAYTHYSYAIRDAIEAVSVPCIEVHISNVMEREDFRKISVIKEVCADTVYGLGYESYIVAINKFLTGEK